VCVCVCVWVCVCVFVIVRVHPNNLFTLYRCVREPNTFAIDTSVDWTSSANTKRPLPLELPLANFLYWFSRPGQFVMEVQNAEKWKPPVFALVALFMDRSIRLALPASCAHVLICAHNTP
jgi:hypothetical protein